MSDIAEQQRRLAENQALFRQLNERIEALNQTFEDLTPYGSWGCECAGTDCLTRIELTLAEYEEVRSNPRRFAVAPDDVHVFPEAEKVVQRGDRYWVVEKIGAAAEVAAHLDPRSSGS